MLASEADRERVSGKLSQAYADGRLSEAELSERLDQVLAARTTTDLAQLTHDLPTSQTLGLSRTGLALIAAVLVLGGAIVVLAGDRSSNQSVPAAGGSQLPTSVPSTGDCIPLQTPPSSPHLPSSCTTGAAQARDTKNGVTYYLIGRDLAMERDGDAPQAVKDVFAGRVVARWGCDEVSGPIGVTGDPETHWRVVRLAAELSPGDQHCFVSVPPSTPGAPTSVPSEAVIRR